MTSYQEVIVWKGWFHTERGLMYGALIKRIRALESKSILYFIMSCFLKLPIPKNPVKESGVPSVHLGWRHFLLYSKLF